MNASIKLLIVFSVLALAACQSSTSTSPLLSAEPEIGAALSRAPRTLRLYYSALPDVSRSSLRLVGPQGELALRGLHTMAADDLMIEILDEVSPGNYTVYWSTAVGDDPTIYDGSFEFSFAP